MLTALEVKTSYSILSSLNRIDKLTEKAAKMGYFSLAITDTNNMFGVYEFYQSCKKNNIKPIIGMEVVGGNDKFILLCKNNDGYKNLIKLSTIISERDFVIEDLKEYRDSLILIMPYDSYNEEIVDIYDDYFIGYSNIEDKGKINGRQVLISDVSYIDVDDYKYLDYLLMIRDDKRLGEVPLGTYKGKHLLDRNEFDDLVDSDVLENMDYIVNTCNVSLEYQDGLLPIYDKNIDSFEFLKNLCYKGINKRLSGNVTEEYKKRLDYELDVINKMGFCDYFLVVWD